MQCDNDFTNYKADYYCISNGKKFQPSSSEFKHKDLIHGED